MSHALVRPAISAVAVLATTLALTLGAVTPAQAAGPWPPAYCAAGQFTAIETTADRQTALHGQVTPCEPPRANDAFALVAFHPQNFGAFAYPHSLVRYQPEGPTPFSAVFRSVPRAGQAGVCAMRTLTDRIACVRVTFPKDGPATMEPIPTTDPLVDKVVFYVGGNQQPTPPPPSGFCGTCLELPTS
ncbi:hypothetical protein [Micromonospora sp. CPCC 206061]|uniref:hypothetical protein n=1 Tax=Micromonospora sp. CPCC 206061 TaxID=3122410 RepID=UPI002FF1CFA4